MLLLKNSTWKKDYEIDAYLTFAPGQRLKYCTCFRRSLASGLGFTFISSAETLKDLSTKVSRV